MPINRINADEYACDGCEKKVLVSRDGLAEQGRTNLPEGWMMGTATQDFSEVDWLAHGISCVKNAISAVIAEANKITSGSNQNEIDTPGDSA